ncbi:MAG: dTDP-4-dehydrorhamnose 3,5-epimerase family protein [Alphaproteobacteria bacterium]|nr:dTDP-4-dehydrorhamnose 3,5-epimerase family protein [Alphaproteobacteria bacterium]
MIDGVRITPLRQIADERGKVMHMLRRDWDVFEAFGEIYFSCVFPGAIKAWHIHKRMTLNYAVPLGEIRFVLYDDRPDSPTKGEVQEMVLGPDNYSLVTVPPMIWNGFKGLGRETSIVANCATIPHDPDEIVRRDPMDSFIPYDWTAGSG